MQENYLGNTFWSAYFDLPALSWASWILMLYGAFMWLACGLTYILSLKDVRTLRGVGIWVKPMKFMAATALFVWTTVWAATLANSALTYGQAYIGITALIVITSFFEVAYITYQAWQGAASHYNDSDTWHIFMFGLMGFAAVGLTASQAWLAWEIWTAHGTDPLSATAWSVILGLTLTFVLSTISGFMLGGKQPPAGKGLPIVGWHFYKDIRPSHFMGVHAQQLIPLWGMVADRFFENYATQVLAGGSTLYVALWGLLTLCSLRN